MGESPGALRTARLDLVPGTIALLEDDLASPERLGEGLGARVPPGWPPGEHDRAAAGWYAWYIVWQGGTDETPVLAGSIGFFGPPREGVVEIGYSVVECFRGRGIASEAITAIAARALALPEVARVIAHTAADNAPSQGALRRAGFHDAGPGAEPGVRRFERLA